MSSGVGLAFLAMAFVELLLDRPRRWMAVWITPVAVVFVVWFLTFGRSGLSAGDTIGVPTLQRIPSYVLSGAVGAIRGLTAFGTGTSLALLAVAVAAAVALLLRRRLPPRAVAAACGLAVFFALIAIGREASPSPGGTPRYVYESALFVILAAAALIGRTADVAGRPLVSVSRSPATLLIALGILAIVVHGFPKNQADLRGGSAFFTDKAGELRAYVGDVGPSPAFDFAAPAIAVPLGIPQPDQMVGLIDRYGSPASDVLWPSVALKPTPAQRDRAFWRLAGGQAVVTTDAAAPPAGGAPPVIESFAGDRLETVGACVRATAPETISMTVGLPPGASVSVQPTDSATGTATFGREAAPQPVNVVSLPLTGGSWTRLRAPTATGSDYHAALEIPSPGPVTVCTTPGG
ncbi:MAG TPA: hypothetical protein VIH37_11220, partial [Candidatus Limnocylindrales bacterium]